ncbi:sigma-54 interaction domain-containing protein [Alteribacillus bidgolensis]|uniref:Transcriptional regulator containing PAS, AAA-type ATPase, and DNA-binding Fis domains n=1 Tax=Alteribacillus bidgolensis TaxID=930129 RepID=A0A1G8K759_9BACI|nr:sigma 54-interacting transcriptional regulator [Alteribacillus bidgolensis]SDI39179.1 Transcriptional regulator containing PAS, AAA-type ATPase, and DNA-binding Fis domains [Alteribacillus bidgolensis]
MSMNKNLTIVSLYKNTMLSFHEEVTNMFGKDITTSLYCFEDETIYEGIEGDLLLIPNYKVFEKVRRYIKNVNAAVIIAKRTLSETGLKKIKNLRKGTNAILYNATLEMSLETISTIHQLDVRQINLIPAYKGMSPFPDVDLIISPNEEPDPNLENKEIINIGNRILDMTTYMDIIAKLDIDHHKFEGKIKRHFSNIIPISYGLERILDKKDYLENQLDLFLQIVQNGIIAVNSSGIVTTYNDAAEQLINRKAEEVIGHHFQDVLPNIQFGTILTEEQDTVEEIMQIGQTSTVLTMNAIKVDEETTGAIATLVPFQETEKRQHRLRTKVAGKGFAAKYHFFNILGNSPSIIKTKDIAQRMSHSDASLLIKGESGTGKELFAQAIHNHSPRRQYSFVAFNCAALPEQLLESELFGYVEGAFTGAKKGGKPGLFEQAHLGTIFLDEIGEMPMALQSRLLRVLQEKEVMRVGGDSIIPIDIRVIAATNRNLKNEVLRGTFRKDLYFRLNVLPLDIPPLRERKEDILPLFSFFTQGHDFTLSEEASNFLINHKWEGNIRELENCANYIMNFGKNFIECKDLPIYKEWIDSVEEPAAPVENNMEPKQFGEKIYFILEVLYQAYLRKERMGRKKIAEKAFTNHLFISEQELRNHLKKMEEDHLVEVGKGRAGTTITKKGIQAIKE